MVSQLEFPLEIATGDTLVQVIALDLVGGIRGLQELQKRVDSGQWQAAFALYPTSIESLMAIADADAVMPPKSTWFEPKLKSGLIVHMLD